jgi:hypothetical protein
MPSSTSAAVAIRALVETLMTATPEELKELAV